MCYAVGLIFGSLMLFGGAVLLHVMPSLFADKIKSQLPIVRGTEAWNRYTTSTVPLQVKMFLFNVTNPEEVENGAKPKLSQVGPFALVERRRKNVVRVSADNTTLDYKLIRTYWFNPNDSIPLDSRITLPNVPAFSAMFSAIEKGRDEGSDVPVKVLSDYLQNATLYQTYTADEWLFKGVKLEFLEALADDGVIIDDSPPDNKFGFYYKKNDTWDEKADGVMTISTGVDGNFNNLGKVVRWNGKTDLSYWKGKHCNTLRGTDGQFFHPFVQKDEKLEIFAPDLCRTLAIQYIKTTSIRSIELYRFGISDDFFKPIDYNEETMCYCTKAHHEAKKFCKLAGVVDVSRCRKKPIVLSTPHFLNGDPLLLQEVDGLAPTPANHDTFIDIEPMTGAVLRVRRRLQVNAELGPTEGFPASQALKKKIIHPFVWLDQSIVIPDELAQKLESKLTKKVRMFKILCYAALITGPIILIATLIFICRDIRSEDKKIQSAKKSNKKDASGDYQKVKMILKPINSGGSAAAAAAGDNNATSNNNSNNKQ